MARTVIPLVTPVGPYSGIQAGWPIGAQPNATALDFVFTASGGLASPNNDQVSLPGKCLVIVNNTSAGALTVSFLSYPNGNPQGRIRGHHDVQRRRWRLLRVPRPALRLAAVRREPLHDVQRGDDEVRRLPHRLKGADPQWQLRHTRVLGSC